MNKQGYSAAAATGQNTLAFGTDNTKKVTIEIAADSNVDFYRVYRSTKGGALSSCKLVLEFKAAASGVTTIEDFGLNRPNTSRVLLLDMSPEKIRFIRLLDFLRRPLAETATAKPFLLMLFGSPVVTVPEHCFSLRNVGASSSVSGVSL